MNSYQEEIDTIISVSEEVIREIGELDISPVAQDELTELIEKIQESAEKIRAGVKGRSDPIIRHKKMAVGE